MELINIYEDYIALNKVYVDLIERLVETDFEGDQETIKKQLIDTKEQLETIMKQCQGLEVDEAGQQNLQDLKYLVTDNLFLATDLVSFYEYEAYGRFKMRVLNYLNKKRRSEI